MDPETTRSWTCATCGRRVPAHVEQCRCGAVRSVVPASPATPEPSAASVLPRVLLAVAVIGVAGVIGFAIWHRPAAPPAVSTAPGPTPPAAVPQAGPASPPPDNPAAPGATAGAAAPPAAPSFGGVPPVAPASLEDVISAALPAVVAVESAGGRGTGFFVAPTMIVTNAHVVGNDFSVTIRGAAGSRPGRVARVARDLDLAIVEVDQSAASRVMLPLGAVARVRPGQEVVAVGSALGMLSNTVTRGIISAVRDVNGITLLQTDAAINPGNSGGPLIDRTGSVVGITTMKVSGQAESLGFALAVDYAQALLEGRPTAATRALSPGDALGSAFGVPAPDSPERLRMEGTATYTRALAIAARVADEIDAFWHRSSAACLAPGEPARGSQAPRAWFAVWERQVKVNSQANGCDEWLSRVMQGAAAIRQEVEQADEAARRAGVYPGDRRDMRRQLRLDWRGWDR